ncbi:translation initiation factor IF-2 [Metamycoplasma sualvi]|uniref:translation initiation factor IF-2 n=1 Tax=Metamycoplasma sualvi TaxID=2125 RepID=UPI003872B31E
MSKIKSKRISNDDEIKNQLVDIKVELKDGVFIFTGPMSVNEFAKRINKSTNEILTNLFKKGIMYTLNSILSEEEIAEICFEYGFDFQKEIELNESNFMDHFEINDDQKDLVPRPPIITIMGHVDHGKTTLIDKIRKSNITSTEAGGITQHTGAYQVNHKKRLITFLDTPGHEAFTAMRLNGAKVTDIVILVVAADDGVMPQTVEAIDHAKAAKVPIIVFINKMDKPNADPEKVKGDLSKHDILAEDWGGDTTFIYGSALTGQGIEDLFEAIILQADILNLRANKNRSPIGTVIEANILTGKGTIATLMITNGTIYKRDFIVAGSNFGRIKTLLSIEGKEIESAGPGTPVIITGLNYLPKSGDKFLGFEDEKFAKKLANKKAFSDKQNELINKNINLNNAGDKKVINLIIKSDVQGTAEAIKYSLSKLSNKDVIINIVRYSSGSITNSDILLAKASNAIIFAFNLKVDASIRNQAAQEKIIIKTSSIIYEIIEEVENIVKSYGEPEYEEIKVGEAVIQKIFFYSKVGNIAGCLTTSGVIKINTKMKLIRNNKVIHEGILETLQHGKDTIKKIEKGKEFGTHIKDFNDIKEGDIIETYENVLINK